MHDIEPHYGWRNLYVASEDPDSPFFGRTYSEIYFSNVIYNHYIHPQWDEFGSLTLYSKILYCDYESQFCIIELIGEWNDLLYNDIMYLYREVIEVLMDKGIQKFILIGDNVLNFHADGNDYYAEWFDSLDNGWIAGINFRKHILEEMARDRIDYYILSGGRLNSVPWRSMEPDQLFGYVQHIMNRLLQ